MFYCLCFIILNVCKDKKIMSIYKVIVETLLSIKSLFYIDVCVCCGCKLIHGESYMCTSCRIDLPKTYNWFQNDNELLDLFAEEPGVVCAVSFYKYVKGDKYTKLIHNIKFRGERKAAIDIGEWFGRILIQQSTILNDIDVIIPMPLHKRRYMYRGYNQSEYISRGIAKSIKTSIDTKSIIRSVNTKSQVLKDSYQRRNSMHNIFKVINSKSLENKHIAIVDDVITTGTSVISLVKTIMESVPSCRITIISLSSVAK